MAPKPEFDSWTNPEGLKLRTVRWKCESPRGLLCIVHGLGEHGLRYQTLADALDGANVDIQTFDLRGHGESDGQQGVANGIDQMVDDLEGIFPTLLERSGAEKTILLGHSMGGGIVGRYATSRSLHPSIEGLVFSSPLMLLPRNLNVNVKLAIGKVLGKLFPKLVLPSGLEQAGISSVVEEVERYKNDPLVHDKISAALGLSFTEVAEEIPLHAGRITTPCLIYHGVDDPIVDIEGTRALARGLGTDDVTFEELKGARHETQHERPETRERVFELLRTFLDQRFGASS